MSDVTEAPGHSPPGIYISYKELVTIRTIIEVVRAKLDTALALKVVTDDHEQRLRALEVSNARGEGGSTVMKHWVTAAVALAGALIGAIAPMLVAAVLHH